MTDGKTGRTKGRTTKKVTILLDPNAEDPTLPPEFTYKPSTVHVRSGSDLIFQLVARGAIPSVRLLFPTPLDQKQLFLDVAEGVPKTLRIAVGPGSYHYQLIGDPAREIYDLYCPSIIVH